MQFFATPTLVALTLILLSGAPRAQDAPPPPSQGDTGPGSVSSSAPEASTPPPAASEAQTAAPAPQPSAPPPSEASAPPAADTPANPSPPPASPAPVKLTIATWGGAYRQSQELAYFDPFKKATGHGLEIVNLGSDDRSAAMIEKLAGDPPWDVVDLGLGTLKEACAEGLLETIDPAGLVAGDGAPPREDFLEGGLQDCGVASVAWSAVVAFDRRAFAKQAPKSLKDMFNLKRFPGPRALPRGPKYTFELALMADGVPPGEVYAMLETEEGIAKALAMLDPIKDQIVWWRRGQEPVSLLADGKAAMALAFNGRTFNAIVRDNRPFAIIWDGQIYDLDLWAIPKNARNKETARKFIAFATEPQRLANQAKWFPYGPMRRTAIALVEKHAEADVDMTGFLPTAPANMASALLFDGRWWAKHEAALTERFEAWLAPKPQTPPENAENPASDAAPVSE